MIVGAVERVTSIPKDRKSLLKVDVPTVDQVTDELQERKKRIDSVKVKRVSFPYEYKAKYNADYYLIDTIKLDSAIVIMEKSTQVTFIKSFDGVPEKLKLSDNTADLLDDGWSLFCDLPFPIDDYICKTTFWKGILSNPGHHIGLLDPGKKVDKYKSKKYEVYTFEFTPDCYILILIKGRKFNRFINSIWDAYLGECNFKDPEAYYPLLYPVYTQIPKGFSWSRKKR